MAPVRRGFCTAPSREKNITLWLSDKTDFQTQQDSFTKNNIRFGDFDKKRHTQVRQSISSDMDKYFYSILFLYIAATVGCQMVANHFCAVPPCVFLKIEIK